MTIDLPEDAYLSTDYNDPQRQFTRRLTYYLDGRLERTVDDQSEIICTFTPDEVAQAQDLLIDCGLLEAEDVPKPADTYDTARQTWQWRLMGTEGRVSNHAYPAQRHPVMECVKLPLFELEQAARDREHAD